MKRLFFLLAILVSAQAFATFRIPLVGKTANYVMVAADSDVLMDATGGARSATLPAANLVGHFCEVCKIDASGNAVTVLRAGSDTINGATSRSLTAQWQCESYRSDGTATWYVIPSAAASIASAVTNTPAGNIAATNVQSAINELDTEKLATGGNAASATTAAACTGNSATVTVADAGGDTTTSVLLGTSATGSLAPATDAGLTYDATANSLTVTGPLAAHGGTATSDVAPLVDYLVAQSAFAQAATNTTGANLHIAPGIGRRFATVVDYTNGTDDTITVSLHDGETSGSVVLTEGIEFSAETSNAQTATNIATAINAWIPGVTASAVSAVVYVTKAATTLTVSLATGDATAWTVTQGTDGSIDLRGATEFNGATDANAPFAFHSSTALNYAAPSSFGGTFGGDVTISVTGKAVMPVGVAMGTSITDLTGGVVGQIVVLLFTDSGTSIADSGNFKLSAAFSSSTDATLTLVYTGTSWVEITRSAN
jgi:hypothetical protein